MKMRSVSKPQLWLLAVITSMIPFFWLLLLLKERIPARMMSLSPSAFTVVTLIYNQASEHHNIEHNCALISGTRFRLVIFTDDMTQRYCSVCECRKFETANCACPDSTTGCKVKNPCEKLWLLVKALREFREIVFIDNDLIILKRTFLEHLEQRARAHDFLATYAHGFMESHSYRRHFNSGLMFMRWKDGVDYDEVKRLMYERKTLQDQGVVSMFVQSRYENWDVLSFKWHCRMLKKMKQDIPPEDCYTIHDRREVDGVLQLLKRKRLRLPSRL